MATMVVRFFNKARASSAGSKLEWSDALLSASWISLLIYFALTTSAVMYGLGHHLSAIPSSNNSMIIRLLHAARFFGIIAPALAKTSFAAPLLPLTRALWERVVLRFVLLSVNLVAWACGFALFFECAPVGKAWDGGEGTCWGDKVVGRVHGAATGFSGVMDLCLTILAVALIRMRRFDRQELIGMWMLVGLGIFASSAGILSSHFTTAAAEEDDFAFFSADIFIWSATETATIIMAVSILSLRAQILSLFDQNLVPSWLRRRRGTDRGNTVQLEGKYRNMDLDEDWIGVDDGLGLDGAPRRGRLVVQDGKTVVSFES